MVPASGCGVYTASLPTFGLLGSVVEDISDWTPVGALVTLYSGALNLAHWNWTNTSGSSPPSDTRWSAPHRHPPVPLESQ
jgi:hypothetical protein